MATLSSFQRIINDVNVIQDSSDHKVKNENYFIVKIELHNKDVDMTDFVKKDLIAKHILNTSVICGYVYRNTAYIIYSSIENAHHYLNGSHHAICSHYASNAAINTRSQAICSIIEFESRTKLLVYFQIKIFENTKDFIYRVSNNNIVNNDIIELTQDELIQKLEKLNIFWDQISSSEKYGSFYKFYVENGTKKFLTLSERWDSKNMDKYKTYFFE